MWNVFLKNRNSVNLKMKETGRQGDREFREFRETGS